MPATQDEVPLQICSFDRLMSDLREHPEAAAANLRLLGIDDRSIDLLSEGAREPPAEPASEPAYERGQGSAPGVGRSGATRRAPVGPAPWDRQHLARRTHASQLWESLSGWWHQVEFVPTGEPYTVTQKVPLYVVAVDAGLPMGVTDACTWTTGASVAGNAALSIGVFGFEGARTVRNELTKSVRVGPGSAARVHVLADLVLQPTQLTVAGERKDQCGTRPVSLAVHRPMTVAEDVPEPIPTAAEGTDEAVAFSGPDDVIEPEPPAWAESGESKRAFTFALPLPTGSSDKLSFTVTFGRMWSAKHVISLPPGVHAVLLPLADGGAGRVLAPERRATPGW